MGNSIDELKICQLNFYYYSNLKKKAKTIYDPDYEFVVDKLKRARRDAGLKQEFVADKIGKYKTYVSKIEHGDRRVDILELAELARLYNKDLEFFVPKKKSSKKVLKK